MDKILVLGNGIAGHTALQEILKSPEDFEITMVWNEVPQTYARTRIIQYAMGQVPDEKFFLSPADFYEKNGIRSLKGEVTSLDTGGRTVTLSTGEVLDYDRLILATGSSNFVPPVPAEGHSSLVNIDSRSVRGLDGVFTMRSLSDAGAFGAKLKNARKAVVSGGGLLGLEAAAALIDAGLEVTTVEFSPRLLPRQLDRHSSELLRRKAGEYGLQLILEDSIAAVIFENDQVKGVRLVSGRELDCDLLLFSVGVRPNDSPFRDQVDSGRGIRIDEYTRTSRPEIFACGDVAEYNGMVYGNWSFSVSSGKTAGQNASGGNEPMKPYVLSLMFNSLDTRIFSTGSVNFDDPELAVFTEGDPDADYIRLFFRAERLVAGILMGNTARGQQIAKAIDQNMSYREAVAAFRR